MTTTFLLIQLYLKEQKFENYKEKISKREEKRAMRLEKTRRRFRKTMLTFAKKMKRFEKKIKRFEKKTTKFEEIIAKQREFIILSFFLTIDFYTATISNCILNDARIISAQGNCYYYQLDKNGKFPFFCLLLRLLNIFFILCCF